MSGQRPLPARLRCLLPTLLTAAAPLACLAVAPPDRGGPPARARPESLARAESERLHEALRGALESPTDRQSLRLYAEGVHADDYLKVEVFGDGVGIWNGKRQFSSTEAQIERALRTALAVGFTTMAPVYGGEAVATRSAAATGGGPVRIVRAVEIEAGGLDKRVEQLARGEQHAPLLELSSLMLSQWRAPGDAGIVAAGLDEGLSSIAAGVLAPETLRLTLHEKPELGSTGSGFLLRLRGRRVTVQEFSSTDGYGLPRVFEMPTEELRNLAAAMAELSPGRLPVNLFANHYIDLTLELLGHRTAVQARRFAGMTGESHGSVQRDFDRLLDSLRALETRHPATPSAPP